MNLAVIQTDIFWEEKLRNLEKIGELIHRLTGLIDILILPEMFNTGFSMDPSKLSEAPRSVTFDWMKSISKQMNLGICGSYMVKDDNRYFNRWVFVSPENETWAYDKRHLFSLTNEDRHFTPGKKRILFSFRGVRICPIICYDLRFPVWSRNKNDYDLLINTANWPESRRDVWITLLKARAIENQCYVAGSNRIGIDGSGTEYCGDSMIINAGGEIIASGDHNEECIVQGEISMNELSDFRRKYPFLNDADHFTIYSGE